MVSSHWRILGRLRSPSKCNNCNCPRNCPRVRYKTRFTRFTSFRKMQDSNMKPTLASQRLSTREEEIILFQTVPTLVCSEINFNCRVTTRVKDLACTKIHDPTSYKLDLICRASEPNVLFHIGVAFNRYPDRICPVSSIVRSAPV